MPKQSQSSKSKKDDTRESKSLTKPEQSRRRMVQRESLASSPFAFMRRFSEEMDRLFEDFGWGGGQIAPRFERGLDQLGALARGTWNPEVEVFERNKQMIIRADLPGLTKDDIQVDVDDDSLVIRGERKSEREEDEEGYYRSERSYGSFYRQIPLPRGIRSEEATANFRNGVLEITMPVPQKTEERRRQLEIGGEREEPRAKARSAGQR